MDRETFLAKLEKYLETLLEEAVLNLDVSPSSEICIFGSILTDRFRMDGENPSDIDLLLVSPHSGEDLVNEGYTFFHEYLDREFGGHPLDFFVANFDKKEMYDSSDDFSSNDYEEVPQLAEEIEKLYKKGEMLCFSV